MPFAATVLKFPTKRRPASKTIGHFRITKHAAANAAADALRQTPGKVLAVANKDAIIISLGSKHGLKSGDKLALYETAEIKDDKGQVVFTDEKLVGEVSILSTQDDRSKVSYAGDKDVKPGWIVKVR